MRRMITIVLGITLLCITCTAEAVFFTIQLKNGNALETAKYWEEGSTVFFFMDGGTAGIPLRMIKHITASDGMLSSRGMYYPLAVLSESADEELLETAAVSDAEQKQEIIDDLTDRINVIETNIINLEKNKNTYLNKRAKYLQDKQRADSQIKDLNIRTNTYLSTNERQEKIEIEQSKALDAEEKIKNVDMQIKNTQDMIENQLRMKNRLKNELVRLQQ